MFRIVLIGDGAVGKSAMTSSFIHGKFVTGYNPTIEDSYRKQVEVDDESTMVEVFDTAGQEDYVSLRDFHILNGDGFIVVFSIVDRKSFAFAKELISNLLLMKENWSMVPLIIAGNKLDLEDRRVIEMESATKYSSTVKGGYLECSAKTGEGIHDVFFESIRRAKQGRMIREGGEVGKIKKKKKGCLIL